MLDVQQGRSAEITADGGTLPEAPKDSATQLVTKQPVPIDWVAADKIALAPGASEQHATWEQARHEDFAAIEGALLLFKAGTTLSADQPYQLTMKDAGGRETVRTFQLLQDIQLEAFDGKQLPVVLLAQTSGNLLIPVVFKDKAAYNDFVKEKLIVSASS